ncbi:unnamed protein product [Arabidopsis lyrata]|nr:unnamed protein product [Arabidopsis lyrata]
MLIISKDSYIHQSCGCGEMGPKINETGLSCSGLATSLMYIVVDFHNP